MTYAFHPSADESAAIDLVVHHVEREVRGKIRFIDRTQLLAFRLYAPYVDPPLAEIGEMTIHHVIERLSTSLPTQLREFSHVVKFVKVNYLLRCYPIDPLNIVTRYEVIPSVHVALVFDKHVRQRREINRKFGEYWDRQDAKNGFHLCRPRNSKSGNYETYSRVANSVSY